MSKIKLIYAQTAKGAESLYNQNLRVYDDQGISPCLCTFGDKNGKIMEIKRIIQGNYDSEDVHSIEGISPTLRATKGGRRALLL